MSLVALRFHRPSRTTNVASPVCVVTYTSKRFCSGPTGSGKTTPFKLSRSFLEKYKDATPPFGFNGLGELVYKRTYSRVKQDGTNEDW